MNSKNKREWKFAKTKIENQYGQFLTDGVIIAGVTGLGYGLAYLYEMSYARHFGIPAYLISPAAPSIVVALLVMVGLIIMFGQIVGIVNMMFGELKLPRLAIKVNIFILFLFFVFFLGGWSVATAISIFSLFLFLLLFGDYAVDAALKDGSLSEKISEAENPRKRTVNHEISPKIVNFLGEFGSIVMVILVFGCMLAIMAGAATARFQKEFQLIQGFKDFAMLRKYGDVHIAIGFDAVKKIPTGEIIIFKSEDDLKRLTLINKEVGPLECFPCSK